MSTLESVLRRDPHHIGANHYYIHAVEASANPERALPSADRLGKLTPGAGHLVHMPGHIYLQMGDYETVAKTNEAAAEADRRYMKATGNTTGVYPLMYYSHNVHFLMVARAEQGRLKEARTAADELARNAAPAALEMPMLQAFMVQPWFVLLRFHRWDEMLAVKAPDPKLVLATALWHFGRGAALASKGRASDAQAELERFQAGIGQLPAD